MHAQAQDDGTERRSRDGYRLLKLDGKELCVAAWARHTGLLYNTILYRLSYGWTIRATLTTPEGQRKKRRYG